MGEEFGGVVTAATGFGIFVTLDAMYVEGLIHITELGGEYFRFDEARQELRGERTGIRYSIGTRVRVQVSRVDLDGRKIDFRMVNETTDLQGATNRAMKDKMGDVSTGTNAGGGVSRGVAGKSRTEAGGANNTGEKSKRGGGRSSPVQRTDRAPVSQTISPIQALKATAKKSAAKSAGAASRKQGKKPRR